MLVYNITMNISHLWTHENCPFFFKFALCWPLESKAKRERFLFWICKSYSQKLTQIDKQILSLHTSSHQTKNEGYRAEKKMEGKKRKWLKVSECTRCEPSSSLANSYDLNSGYWRMGEHIERVVFIGLALSMLLSVFLWVHCVCLCMYSIDLST